jgi:vancomycin resistance protein YoaR
MGKVKISKKVLTRRVALGVAGFCVLILLSLGVYSFAYASRVLPHQYFGGTKVSGYKKSDLTSLIKSQTEKSLNTNLVLNNSDQNKNYEVGPMEVGLSYDVDATVNEIWSKGRNNNVFLAIGEEIKVIFTKTRHQAIYSVNEDSLRVKIKQISAELDQPEKDYSIIYKDGKYELSNDRVEGKRINQEKIELEIKNNFANVRSDLISFSLESFKPQVNPDKAQVKLDLANKILAAGELVLKYNGQDYKVDVDTIGGFISSRTNKDDLDLVFNTERAQKYAESLAKSIDVNSVSAKLTIVDGKVTVFQNSVDGRTLDVTETLNSIEDALFSRIQLTATAVDPIVINLKVAIKKPDVSNTDISSLGINELIGTATTSFAGSPANRIHNIQIGASAINGTLLGAGEEFSTLSHLGTIDGTTGYLEELVIKDNKTVPEFGGGLCQVSSTLFRAALNAGMKITQRSNHSYRVSYYEPPIGMDATIYDPAPDFKFVNNYKSHLLVQSKIVGNKITFDFYGTKDDRKIEISTPVTTEIVNPPSPVYIETDTLGPGEKKQTGKAHQGATANFHYKVTDSAGTVLQDKTFTSVYKAIAEQWLIGKAAPVVEPVVVPACNDGVRNGDEAGVDCGGSCPNQCS